MLPTVSVASAVTPGLFTFSIAWSPWWRAVVWQQRAISRHTEILPPACAGKGKGENCSTSLILPESWPPLAGFPGGKGGSPRLVTLPQTLARLATEPAWSGCREASGLHGPLCTSWQEANAVTPGLGLGHCRGETSWKISTQKCTVEVRVKLNVPNML